MILAIDPGTTESGWVLFAYGRVYESGIDSNEDMLARVYRGEADELAIEMIASFGMPVGKEIFETCVWIGRFVQQWKSPDKVRLIYRKDVKMHLCGSPRAKDANINQALVDLIGPKGTKKNPGPCFGVKSHAWAALGVAVTAEATRV